MPTFWLPIITALVISLVKLLIGGKQYKDMLLFTVLMVVVSAFLSVFIDFLFAYFGGVTFVFTLTTLAPYFIFAIVGAVIVPIAIRLVDLKLK